MGIVTTGSNHDSRVEGESGTCDSCSEAGKFAKASKPEPSLATIMMASIGGLLAGCGFRVSDRVLNSLRNRGLAIRNVIYCTEKADQGLGKGRKRSGGIGEMRLLRPAKS
jgi:hypothetical protein